MLFEESGIILTANEHIIAQGRCKGKIPKGLEMKTGRTLTPYQTKTKQNIAWKEIDGELVVTNKRAIILYKEGIFTPKIVSYNLDIIGVATKKEFLEPEKLELLLDVGKPQTERTLLQVRDPAEWVLKIREFVSQKC